MSENILYTINLINEDYLKAYSPIPVNYNYDEIRPFITVAERVWIADILGEKLYEELLDQVEKDEISEENSTLLLKIYPYLAIAVIYEALPFIAYHFTEVGITQGKSENSEPISNEQLTNIQNHLRTELEVLKRMLIEWLNAHSECYALYCKNNIKCADDICVYADMLWMDMDTRKVKEMRWRNLYQTLKNNPNVNIRMYGSNRPL